MTRNPANDAGAERLGLTNDELSSHGTAFAADALQGQGIMVAGIAGGIGRAVAWLLARLGAHIVAVGRNRSKLDLLVDNLSAKQLTASAHVVDIKNPEAAVRSGIWLRGQDLNL